MDTTDNPDFKPFTNDFTEEEALNRRARAIAATKNLFQTDISKLDDAQVSGLYQATARALLQIEDPDGKVAFGKKAGDARTNVGLLRDFCKGNYKLIQDDEYESWRAMDEEKKFRYALENESKSNKAKSNLGGQRGAGLAETLATGGMYSGVGLPAGAMATARMFAGPKVEEDANAQWNELARRSNYESLTPEEQALYRRDVIEDYEKKLSKRQVLATYLAMTDGLSDRASTLLAKAYNTGTVDVEAMEALPQKERDQAYTALSIMRGDQKKGHILGIPTDFTDDTTANRLQLCLYGFQQGVLGLIPDTYELGKDASKWTYAKFCLDDAERKRYIDRWDAQVRAEQALKQGLPEADSWWGAGFQGAAESAALLVPYLGIGKGGKMMRAATAVNKDASWLKRTAAMLNPLRAGSQHRARAKLVEGVKAVEEAEYADTFARLSQWKTVGGGDLTVGNQLLARQLANIENYTKELRELKKLSRADLRKWGLGAASWSSGEATAFGSFAKEYVETCDAAGISRYDSVPMAAIVGLINAQIEHLYVPGLESTLSASEVKSLTVGSLLQTIKSDGAKGFWKWLGNRVEKGVVEGGKVVATEGGLEEPAQQIVIEHGKAISATAQKLREEGRGDLADQLSAYWDATKDTLATDFQTFIDTTIDSLPSSVVFGATTIGNQTRRQHLHNIMTRHENRAKYAREVERAKAEGREIPAPPVMLTRSDDGKLDFNPDGVDYDVGIADMIGKAAATQKAVTDYWAGNGQEKEGEDVRLANAFTAARKAWDSADGDALRKIADAAQVDMRTAEVIAEYFIAEDETKLYSPQLRAFADYSLSAADMSEGTLERILPGYVKGSYKADEKNGVYSGQVKLEDGSVKTIAYKVGDISEELLKSAEEQIRDDSELGKSHDARIRSGDGNGEKLWAKMTEQERYAYALRGVNAIAGGAGVIEMTDAGGNVSRISADDIIYLSNGRFGDVGYGPMANLGTARHETWHAIWRFTKSTFTEDERRQLADKLGVDTSAEDWEADLDEAMAYQFELYASGSHVPHVTTGAIDRLMQSTAAKLIGQLSKFGLADEVKNAKTGKPFALADFYDAVMRGEIGTGRLGIAQVATETPQPGAAEAQKKTKKELPVSVSEEELAEAEDKAAEAAAEAEPEAPEHTKPQPSARAAQTPKATYTLDNPANASVPDACFYRISAGDGVDLVGELVVSDARDLKTSYKGNLSDPSLQNRAETNEGRSLVEKIAGSPDPLQVGTVQPRANNGFVWTTPSLDTFIGNTRESGISAAYEKGNAGAVKAYMLAEAEKRGIEVPDGVEQPIVHFVLRRIESKDGKASIQDVVRMTNQSVNRGMNVYEQAKNDADVLVGAGLVPHIVLRPDGRIDTAKSAEAIGRFIQETGAQGMVDENSDTLTEDGQERLQNAVLAALLGNENADTVAKMMREADRLDIENEKRSLMKTAAELMRIAAEKPQYDLRQPLAEALGYYLNWRDVDELRREEAGKNRRDWYERTKDGTRKRGLTWEMHMGQGDMFRTPSPEARLLGDLLASSRDLRSFDAEDRETDAGKKRAQDLVTTFIGDYIRNADAVNTETVDLLGTPPPSRIELLETHRGTDASRRFSTVSTDTPAFKVWFADSKVVDADGRPLKVYRGSPYDPLKQPAGKGVIKPEAYFTADPEYARRYGKVNAYYLRMRKPFDIRNDEDAARLREFYPQGYQFAVGRNGALDWGEMANFDLDELREKYPEYDGIILDEGGDPQIDGSVKDRGVSYVPFDGGAQVKSATDNSGAFDPANPDIRYSTIAAAISDESRRRRMDAEHADAVKRGDMATASRMVREAAEKAGYVTDSSYQGTSAFNGAAPSANGYFANKEERKAAWEDGSFEDTQTLGDYIFDGIDINNFDFILGDERYRRHATPERQEAVDNLRGVLSAKGKKVRMYRSVPSDVKEESFRNGDWITPSRSYAEENARIHGWGDKFRIIEQDVSVEDVWWDGNDIAEWGFDDGKEYAYRNTKNNRKLLAPATYDNAGKLIPLSKRFDPKNPDIRFSTTGLYTGSAADYEKPSLHYVGSGEGAQVYGWGLYASSERGVAENYAKVGGEAEWKKNGKPLTTGVEALVGSALNRYGSVDLAEMALRAEAERGYDRADELRELREHGNEYKWTRSAEHLYEQTFFTNRAPGDESHLLKWYEPVGEENERRILDLLLNEQNKKTEDWITEQRRNDPDEVEIREREIRELERDGENTEGLREFTDEYYPDDIYREYIEKYIDLQSTGGDVYRQLAEILGSPQAASEFLVRADIDGIKYPVDSYGKTVKDGDKAGWNYVSFRDDDIRVDHKWVDGQQRFSTVKVGKVNVPIVTDYEAAKAIDPKQPKTIEKYILEHLKNDVVMAEGGLADINSKTARHYGWSKVRGKRDRNLRRARAKAAAILEDILKQVRATKQTEQPDKHGRGDKVWRCRLPFAIPTFDPKTRLANGVNVFDGDVIVKDEGHGKFLYDISELEKNEALTRQLTQQMLRGRNNGASNMTQSAMSASVAGSIAQPAEKVNAPRRVFSTVGSAYPALNRLSDEQLIAVALASKTVFGKAGKKQSRFFTINEVQRHIKALHPDWDGPKVSLESTRIYQLVRPIKAKLQEDIQRGVSESKILQHLPERLKEEFGSEMTQQARTGARIGTTHQRAASLLEERKVKVVEDAVRVQSGIESQLLENQYGIDLSRTLMNLADNPYLKKDGQGNFLPPPGVGFALDGRPSGTSENPAAEEEVDEKVKKSVSEIVGKTKEELDQSEANRRSLSDQRWRDAEREAELAGEANEGGGLDPADGDIVEIATRKAGVDLQNPRHLALFVTELARRHWVKSHGLAEDAEAFKDAVALQFLRKTAQDVYRKLVHDITYSQSRDSATAAINGFEHVPTLRGLISEMTFAGQLINARKIRETAQEMCEKLDTSLQENFGASGRFKPDNEELRRKVSTEMELRARYTRHAIWLTPNAAGKEADLLQKEIDAASADFEKEDHDAEQSRVMVENIRKINILREFGGLRYKPLAQIQSALEYWDNAQQGESEQIARENLEREIRTKKAAEVLAKAIRNPNTKYAKDGKKLLSAIDNYITGHMGFTHLLRDMMRYASNEDAAAAEKIVQYLELEIQKDGTRVMTQKRRHADALAKAVQQIYGRNFGKVLAEFCKEDERFAEFMGETDGKKDMPTKGRAMQLMVSLLQVGRQVEVIDPEDPKKTKLEWQGGYHDNIVKHHREGQAAKIAALLKPQDLQLVKWLGNWYDTNRQELSSVCRDLFGIGVYAETSNYMPVKMRLDAQGLEKGDAVGWTIFPKALMPRVRNERDFDTRADILQMFMARMEEGEQWKAHARLGLETRGIFGRSELQAAVIASHGTKANAIMLGFVTDILAGQGARQRAASGDAVENYTDWIRGWAALGALGGNVGVTFKQTTSIPAFGFEVGLVKTGRYMLSAFTPDGMSAMKKIWDSDERKNRWNVGNSEAVANALAGNDVSLLKRFMRASMITNKVGDCVPGLVCGQGIYRDCIEQGMDEEDAMAKTWMLIERTQQSGRIENQAGFQRRTKFGRALYQFLTTQQQYLSYEARAIRSVAAKPGDLKRWGELGETLLLNHFLLSSAYYWMGQLYKRLLGQEPDDDGELADWMVTCLLGPYGALYGLGITTTEAVNTWIKGRQFGTQGQLPSLSWASNFIVHDPARLVGACFDEEKTFDDVLDAAAKWASDSNAIFRDLRKVYRWRIKEEPQ